MIKPRSIERFVNFGTLYPRFEVLRTDFVVFDRSAVGFTIGGIKVEPMLPGNEPKSEFRVGTELYRVSNATREVTGW